MVLAYKGLIPLLPLPLQLFTTLFAVIAPHLPLLLLASPLLSWWLLPFGLLGALWRLCDPIGGQIWPSVTHFSSKCGIYGGSDEMVGMQRQAIIRVAQTYRPTPWLWGGDQRTLAVAVGGKSQVEELAIHHVSGCRGSLVVHLRACSNVPVVFVLGGIMGDPKSPFNQDMQHATKAKGWGFGMWVTKPNLLVGDLASAPNFTDMSDVHACLDFVKETCHNAPVYLIGYSMGGVWVALYCAQYGDDAKCDAAVAISGTFTPCPLYSAHYRRYWQPWLTAQLLLLYYEKFGNELPPRETVAGAAHYEELINCLPHVGPVSRVCTKGFANAERDKICRPLLFFASADDPFHPIDDLGIDPTLPSVLYFITEVGGHVAWPEGWTADCSSFHTRVIFEFLEASSR